MRVGPGGGRHEQHDPNVELNVAVSLRPNVPASYCVSTLRQVYVEACGSNSTATVRRLLASLSHAAGRDHGLIPPRWTAFLGSIAAVRPGRGHLSSAVAAAGCHVHRRVDHEQCLAVHRRPRPPGHRVQPTHAVVGEHPHRPCRSCPAGSSTPKDHGSRRSPPTRWSPSASSWPASLPAPVRHAALTTAATLG